MDITPMIPAGRQIIESYGDGGFRVSGKQLTGSIIVFPSHTIAWPIAGFDALDMAAIEPILAEPDIELLLVGCGARLMALPPDLRRALKARGIGADTMGTGAAARTYNVLVAEDRRVAAALIAVV